MLAGPGEEGEFIKCFNDIAGKGLPWQAVKQAPEQESKYLRQRGVYEKVDVQRWQSSTSPRLTKWVDTDKAFEGEPMQVRSRRVAREFKSGDSELHR